MFQPRKWELVVAMGVVLGAGAAPAASPAERPPIVGIAHLALQVEDLVRTRAFYEQVLGLDPLIDAGRADPAELRFRINDRQFVEVRGGLGENMPDRMARPAFETTDAEAMRVYLAEQGLAVPSGIERHGDGTLRLTVTAFPGHLVELVQYLPDSLPLQARGRALSARRFSERLSHVGIPVSDEAAALRFYRDILGFAEILRVRPDLGASTPNWVNLKLSDAAAYVELMLATPPDERQRSLSYHLGLAVPDVQAAYETARDLAASHPELRIGTPILGRNNRWQVPVFDLEGRRHELMEPHTAR
jgi:catechol 2,3-dioxygenase-like lactoylglutathione lyase family enzyme